VVWDGRRWEHDSFDLTLDESHRIRLPGDAIYFCDTCGKLIEPAGGRWQHVSMDLTLDEHHAITRARVRMTS
jgi:hypothetical protein